MKSFLPLFPSLLVLASSAQDIAPKDSERIDVLETLEADEQEAAFATEISATAGEMNANVLPLLVTGKPPADAEFLQPLEAPEPTVPEPEGVSVRVEPGTANVPTVAGSDVRLLAPFPAKPLFPPPAGWRLEHPESVPAFVREVALENGSRISLAIRPHLLVPDSDGDRVLAVTEPGFDASRQYAQTGTVGAVLADSIEGLDGNSKRLGEVLGQLEQLLGSLPNHTPSPAAPNTKER